MKLMVFDVGGTDIKYSVMDENLNRWAEGSTPTPMESLPVFLETLRSLYLPHQAEVEGIAMSLPGFIDTERGRVNGGGALTYNWNQDVGPQLSALCGCPVHMGNDGKCAAMAELWKGSLRGCSNASVFLMGTGVGGGLIIDGKVVNGRHFTAGEYSFVQCNDRDWTNPGETMAGRCSTRALLERYQEQTGEEINGRQFFARLEQGDEAARQALDVFCMDTAVQIYNLTMLLDLEKVAIGGGISRQPALLETLCRKMDEFYEKGADVWGSGLLPRTEVVTCTFGSEANQVGAVCLFRMAEGLPV